MLDEHFTGVAELKHFSSDGVDIAFIDLRERGEREKHGIIPAWLAVVYAVMLVWMVWYTITFWTDKG